MNGHVDDGQCCRCPRLVAFREHNRQTMPNGWNAPVPPSGDGSFGLAIVGLAPGLKGANRTGLPFVGDASGDLVNSALSAAGIDPKTCRITNAVRCVPPGNRPTAAEFAACAQFLRDDLNRPPRPRIVLALGAQGLAACARALGIDRPPAFRHGVEMPLPDGRLLISGYHPSPLNMATGRLTRETFTAFVETVGRRLDAPPFTAARRRNRRSASPLV